MYSFEGEFRRKPEQNYAGASVHEPVSNLIQRARYEREQREVCFKILCKKIQL